MVSMEIFIKLAPRDYSRLRSHVPIESAAYEAVEKASRIDHYLEGVSFRGYTIRCDERQARIILEIAKQCCPEIVPDIDRAMMLAQPG
jgi:hypothetical protein